MTTNQVECLKEIVNQKKNDERNFKIRGALTSCVAESQSFENSISQGYERVVFKILLDKTGCEDPDKWETCMLLNEELAKSSNNCLFLNAMVTAEQWYYNDKDGFHIFDVHQHTEKD